MSTLFVGIRGYRRAGKDTLAQFMIDEWNKRKVKTERRAFGDSLKEELAAFLAVMRPEKSYQEHLRIMYSDGPEKEKYRKLFEFWGTEFRRGLWGQNYWIERLDIWAKDNCKSDVLVIPDVRFSHECSYIKEKGGILIHIINPRIKEEDIGTHSAEHELDSYKVWDFTVVNDSDLDDLRAKAVTSVVNHISVY